MTRCDVPVVGCGPVSQPLVLGRKGLSASEAARWRERYSLPRTVCIAHELHRVLAGNVLADELLRVSPKGARYQWFNVNRGRHIEGAQIDGGPDQVGCWVI